MVWFGLVWTIGSGNPLLEHVWWRVPSTRGQWPRPVFPYVSTRHFPSSPAPYDCLLSWVYSIVYKIVYSVVYSCCFVHDKYVGFSHTCRVVISKSVKTNISYVFLKIVLRQRRQILKMSKILKFTLSYLPSWGETFHENNSFCLQSFLKYAIKEEYQLTQPTINFFFYICSRGTHFLQSMKYFENV